MIRVAAAATPAQGCMAGETPGDYGVNRDDLFTGWMTDRTQKEIRGLIRFEGFDIAHPHRYGPCEAGRHARPASGAYRCDEETALTRMRVSRRVVVPASSPLPTPPRLAWRRDEWVVALQSLVELVKRLDFDLTNAFARNANLFANFFEGQRLLPVQSVPQPENSRFAFID